MCRPCAAHPNCMKVLQPGGCSPRAAHEEAAPCPAAAGMYYGGEPVEWTDSPSIPHAARYEVMHKPPPVPKAAAAGGAAAGGGGAAARPAGQQQYAVAGSRIVNKHPLADVRRWGGGGAC